MVRFALVSALAALGLSAPALAEEVTVAEPLAAASLHEGPVDLVAYYVAAPDGLIEVVATAAYAEPRGAAPVRVTMALADGDSVSFGLPGMPGTAYGFARSGDALTVRNAALPQLALAQ